MITIWAARKTTRCPVQWCQPVARKAPRQPPLALERRLPPFFDIVKGPDISVLRRLSSSSWGSDAGGNLSKANRPSWSPEWRELGLGAELMDGDHAFPQHLFFVQTGTGVDQHGGQSNATKAAVRAVRNAIEGNSIPGVITHVPGGRHNMLIHVKLGVPTLRDVRGADCASTSVPTDSSLLDQQQPLPIDPLEVAKVFPYGKLLPLQVVVGGLSFFTGRIVPELGDANDVGIAVMACVTIGYNENYDDNENAEQDCRHTVRNKQGAIHLTYNTKDGY